MQETKNNIIINQEGIQMFNTAGTHLCCEASWAGGARTSSCRAEGANRAGLGPSDVLLTVKDSLVASQGDRACCACCCTSTGGGQTNRACLQGTQGSIQRC
jgi:hypothetical protein